MGEPPRPGLWPCTRTPAGGLMEGLGMGEGMGPWGRMVLAGAYRRQRDEGGDWAAISTCQGSGGTSAAITAVVNGVCAAIVGRGPAIFRLWPAQFWAVAYPILGCGIPNFGLWHTQLGLWHTQFWARAYPILGCGIPNSGLGRTDAWRRRHPSEWSCGLSGGVRCQAVGSQSTLCPFTAYAHHGGPDAIRLQRLLPGHSSMD